MTRANALPTGRYRTIAIWLGTLLLSWSVTHATDDGDAEAAGLVKRIGILEDAGKQDGAVPLYEDLLARGAMNSTLMHQFARTLIVTGDHRRIVELMRAWLPDHPSDAEAGLRLGRALVELNRGPEALAAWRKTLEANPHSPHLHLQISNLCAASGMRGAAIEVLLDGRERLGGPPLFSWELASLFLTEENYHRAVTEYLDHLRANTKRYAAVENRLVSVAADSTRSSLLLQALRDNRRADDSGEMVLLESVCLLEAGEPNLGLDLLVPAIDRTGDINLLYRYAARCHVLGRGRTAARAYSNFIDRSPSSLQRYRALLQLADVHQRLGEYAAATEAYSRLAAEYPGRREAEEALFELGRLQLEVQRDAESATVSLTAALDSSPRGPWAAPALTLLAECALAQGDLDRSDAYLTQLLRTDPKAFTVVRYRRAELSYFRADFAAAVAQLSELLAADAGHELGNDALHLTLLIESASGAEPALSSFALSQLRLRQGRPEEAVEHWKFIAEHASPDLRQRSILSQAGFHLDRGDGGRALSLYEELVRMFPKGDHAIEAHVRRARLYEAGGQARTALKAYETALLAFPDHVRASEIRLQVDRLRRLTTADGDGSSG